MLEVVCRVGQYSVHILVRNAMDVAKQTKKYAKKSMLKKWSQIVRCLDVFILMG
jgi:hypothetical protein